MDLYVERQCVEQMKDSDPKKFLMLFDANFEALCKYVFRRVGDSGEAEKILRLAFLDALGQIQNTPVDIGYIVWLYSLAKPRVWEYVSRTSFPTKQGLIGADEVEVAKKGESDFVEKVSRMLKKLSLEEREILQLKFFEEVADGDVMTVLGTTEGVIGPKIYRVLKRAHLLLFGESDEKQGVYFGELSGFLAKARDLEKIEIPMVLKLSLRADLEKRIDRKEMAIESEEVSEFAGKEMPFVTREEANANFSRSEKSGSKDPAKIFVAAVKEMKEEEALSQLKEQRKFEREEFIMDVVERFKGVLLAIPVLILVVMVAIFVFGNLDFEDEKLVERGYPTACSIEVEFDGDFTDGEKRSVNSGVSDRLCDHFEVKKLLISRKDEGKVEVKVDVPRWFLDYKFAKKMKEWRIKEYAKTTDSDQQSRKILRNIPRS